jgi:hypothetical protein
VSEGRGDEEVPEVGSVPDHGEHLEATVDSSRRAGVHCRNDIVTGVGGHQIRLEDPSGNPVELFEPTRADPFAEPRS